MALYVHAQEDGFMRSTYRYPLLAILALVASLLGTGFAHAEITDVAGSTGQTGITLQSQDATGVDLHFEMGYYKVDALEINGETVQKVSMPGVFLPNDAGAPDLPGVSCFVAVPQGATASYEIVASRVRTVHGYDLGPAPVIPRENDDSPLVYARDLAIYSRNAYYPESSVMVSEPTLMRGLDVVAVGITPFQYNPVTKELKIFTEFDLRVTFHGGNGQFGEDALRSRYWEPILRNNVVNYASLPEIDFNRPTMNREGYEYVIISPDNPDFVAWADTLADWRTLQGIKTGVFTTTDIGGTSSTAIENFLNDAYDNWEVRPVAFLLLGDYPNSGDRDTGITSPTWGGYCVSDNIYADRNGNDLPDMAHGRICARDAGELQTMIGKMLSYEREPITNQHYYDHPVIAGGWQTERWFILCTEICLGHQVNVLGKEPVREYAIYSGTPGSSWSTNQNTYMLLDYFGPEGLGYIPSTPQHLTDWGGNAARLNNDLNQGAYMLLHRDHGYELGWGEPDYNNGDLNGLTGDYYPFVFSINCLTGKYNYGSETFTEKFHRIPHGAVGVIAASEISYSFVNDTFIFGMFDGLWDDFMPDQQVHPVGQDPLRTAFAMCNGKHFLQGSSWPYNTSNKDETHHLFHHHGDAFIQMYSEMPQLLSVVHDGILFTDVNTFTIQADEGAMIALTVNGQIIGLAEATGLPQDIEIIPQSEPGDLRITITMANHFRHDEVVPILPPSGPYLIVEGCVIDDDLEGDSAGNADGGADAGETLELVVSLENVGTETADNVRATLTCEDEYITIVDDFDQFGSIPSGITMPCDEDFVVVVSPDCPDGHIVSFMLVIESDNRMVWEKNFSMAIEAPVLEFVSYLVDDAAGGNGNGRVEPGETFDLYVTVGNSGSEDATGVNVNLAISHPEVDVPVAAGTINAVPAGSQIQMMTPLTVTVGAAYPDPDMLHAMLFLRGDWAQDADLTFQVPVGGFFDEMETGVGDWTSYIVSSGFVNQWHQSTTRNYTPGGTYSWKFGDTGAGDYASLADGALETEPLTLRPVSYLKFRHWMDAEFSSYWTGYAYDGGRVEMSINGGAWEQIFPLGGYNYLVREGGTPGPFEPESEFWSGNIVWEEETFEINGLEGEVRFRFRFGSDGAENREGWYIDDLEFTGYGDAFSSEGEGETVPVALHPVMGQNFPNPFGPSTTIGFRLPERTDVLLRVYDASGRMVRTLMNGAIEPGAHTVTWDGRNDGGEAVGSGVYFYRFEVDDLTETRKMILTR